MQTLVQDFRYGFRMLLRTPVISGIAILTLALGIGGNTAIFSVMDSLILRTLPVADPGRLVLFGNGQSMGSTDGIQSGSPTLFSYPMFREFRKNSNVFSDIAAIKSIILEVHGRLQGGADMEKMRVQMVSGSYFPVLGINAKEGRLLTDADDQNPGGHPMAVASYSWWKRRLGEESFTAGKTVTIGSTVYSIIGITPSKFFGTTVGDAPDFWIPLSMEAQISPGWNGLENRMFQAHHVIARLKPGVEITKATAEINIVYKNLLQSYAGPKPSESDLKDIRRVHIDLTPAATGLSQLRSQFSKPLNFLMAVVALVLLIACANVANLMLARAMARQREIAIRTAVGAARSRLIQQLVTESMLLALIGGALGIFFAWRAAPLLVTMVSTGSDSGPLQVSIDLRVLAFTSAVAVLTALLFGIVPAFRATNIECAADLKYGKGSSANRSRNALARGLLIGQVATSLALLAGAGLFLRTLVNLTKIETGFKKENVLLFQVDESSAGYKEDARLANLHRQFEELISGVPGVQAASFSLFNFNQGGWTTRINTATPPAGPNPIVTHNVIGPRYFKTMGIPLLAGRSFGPQDTDKSTKVAIVNETLARRFFPTQSPLGQRFRWSGPETEKEIIGIVKDAKYENLREETRSAAYYPHSQQISYLSDFEVRYTGNTAPIIASIRRAVTKIDANLPFSYRRTLSQEIDRSVIDQRLTAQVSSFFALLALFLACIGIYGVTSYAVSRQTREIGIRMALGAQRAQVLMLILRHTIAVLAAGLGIGLPAIVILQQLIAAQLYGLPELDLISICAAVTLLLLASILASYLPARHATKVDPMEALRYE